MGNGNLLFYFFSSISVDGRDLHTKRKGHGIVMNYLLGVFSCTYVLYVGVWECASWRPQFIS